MATKKKSKKEMKSKKTPSKKKLPKKKLVKKKALPKKAAMKAKSGAKKVSGRKRVSARKTRVRGRRQDVGIARLTPAGMGARSGGQSGSLQGLSDIETADSESVDELIEEGNAFEAEVVKGVEDVPDEEEVHTHELPEDDVPGEYSEQ